MVKIRKWFNENVEVVDGFEIFSLGQTVVSCVVLCIHCNQAKESVQED